MKPKTPIILLALLAVVAIGAVVINSRGGLEKSPEEVYEEQMKVMREKYQEAAGPRQSMTKEQMVQVMNQNEAQMQMQGGSGAPPKLSPVTTLTVPDPKMYREKPNEASPSNHWYEQDSRAANIK